MDTINYIDYHGIAKFGPETFIQCAHGRADQLCSNKQPMIHYANVEWEGILWVTL